MKKKRWIIIIAVMLVLAVLLVPIPSDVYKDGGTREWKALTYRVVDWNRLTGDGIYSKTKVYFGGDCFKSLDTLWYQEFKNEPVRTEYTEEWLDKEKAEFEKGANKADYEITAIYENCFFVTAIGSSPCETKINGKISDDWCVGDHVLVSYRDLYTDLENYRMEAELEGIEVSDFKLEPGVDYKPVIYLYPEQKMDVEVTLTLDGRFTCTYPTYQDGWRVTAMPDGTLTDEKGQTYNYLYWEGETYAQWDMTKGFCVKGEDTAAFLEDALAKLGLTRREANEFIVFWLPLMQENPYNLIAFQTEVYTESAKLEVKPQADTTIRVFMAYQPSEEYVELETQELSAPERVGFTVVEWGGTKAE